MIRPWMNAASDWVWNQIFTWLERHPTWWERTPEQQAEYERQGRLSDERARVAYLERMQRQREEGQ